MGNAKTTKELYEQLLEMPDLHSAPALDGEILTWKLYENAYVHTYCDSGDTYIGIVNTSSSGPSTHWHPNEDDMLDELYLLGKKGNILVLKNFLMGMGTEIFYLGEPENYRFNKKRKWHWGRLFYFEQK